MKSEEEIEDFTKFIFNEAKLESPSKDFVVNVMKSIEIENNKKSQIVFKPLISKLGWLIISVLFVSLCIFLVYFNGGNSIIYSYVSLSFVDAFERINILENIEVPEIFMFCCLVFAALVFFQLHYIRKYFNPHNLV